MASLKQKKQKIGTTTIFTKGLEDTPLKIHKTFFDSTPVYTNSIKDDCEEDKYYRKKYCFTWSRENYCNHRIFKGKVIIHKSRGEVSLVMQDTIEYSLFNSFFLPSFYATF